jgi:hypothetical protein
MPPNCIHRPNLQESLPFRSLDFLSIAPFASLENVPSAFRADRQNHCHSNRARSIPATRRRPEASTLIPFLCACFLKKQSLKKRKYSTCQIQLSTKRRQVISRVISGRCNRSCSSIFCVLQRVREPVLVHRNGTKCAFNQLVRSFSPAHDFARMRKIQMNVR